VTPPQTVRIARQVITVTYLDVRALDRAAVPYLTFTGSNRPAPELARPGRRVRVYLAPVRMNALVHTLAIVVDAPSQHALGALSPVLDEVLRRLDVGAAAGPSLSALSSMCSVPWMGTCLGELDAGTHTTKTLRPALTYAVPLGWTNFGDQLGFAGLIPPGGDFNAVDTGQSDYVDVFTSIATAREGCADGTGSVHTPGAFVHWLEHEPGLVVTKPVPVSIGGLSGFVVDIRMRKDWTRTCRWSQGVPAAQILTGRSPSPGGLAHGMLPQPMVMRLYLLAYKGGTLGIEVDEVKGSSKLATYSRVVRSFRFTLR
jgi:hypothetical protein